MRQSHVTRVCFRNDDVNSLTPELIRLTDIFASRGVPITHAVEPANLTLESERWLRNMKERHPNIVEIVQHGWAHTLHGRGEFDGTRSFSDQLSDLARGKKKMEDGFAESFFPMLTIPFGVHNRDTIKAAHQLGYRVICTHYNYHISRRLFYLAGHILRRGRLLGRNVSNHLKYYPGTRIFVIDSAISFTKRYFGHFTNDCLMSSLDEMLVDFDRFRRLTPVVVLLIHHRFHHKARDMKLVEDMIDKLEKRDGVLFYNYEKVYREYR